MGNFNGLLEAVRVIDENLKDKLKEVYRDKEAYLNFAQNLRKKMMEYKARTKINFFFILPDFEEYYGSSIDYNKPL